MLKSTVTGCPFGEGGRISEISSITSGTVNVPTKVVLKLSIINDVTCGFVVIMQQTAQMIFRQCLDENVFGLGNLCPILVSHIVVFYTILEENKDHQAQVCLFPTGNEIG